MGLGRDLKKSKESGVGKTGDRFPGYQRHFLWPQALTCPQLPQPQPESELQNNVSGTVGSYSGFPILVVAAWVPRVQEQGREGRRRFRQPGDPGLPTQGGHPTAVGCCLCSVSLGPKLVEVVFFLFFFVFLGFFGCRGQDRGAVGLAHLPSLRVSMAPEGTGFHY